MSDKKPSRFDQLFGAARSAQSTDLETDPNEVKHSDVQTSKSKDPNYQRTTLYLPKALHRQFKMAALNDDREMSEIMEELISKWLESRKDN
jgi:hypothetical protein